MGENPPPSATDDKVVRVREAGRNVSKTKTMLKKLGAISIDVINNDEDEK
jgi:hypothetical protein